MHDNQLRPVWDQVEKLLADGISLIPVRDKDEGNFVKKSPYKEWKKYQSSIIDKEELFHQMEHHKTTAVAMLCGKVSGNLEVIDIDVKWYPGIDALFFKSLVDLYPELFHRLRIHRTPTGGFHILYRIEDSFLVPGNQKLARRPSSDAELLVSKEKAKCFFETRGEGGYVLAPPSLGYSVHQDVPLPVLSSNEREAVINLARVFNQVFKEDKPYTAGDTNHSEGYYEVNPFEDFNNSQAGADVLLEFGWTFKEHSGDYTHFTRPGSTSNVIHGSFIRSKRIFYVFSTNTELEPERGYKPATILSLLKFNDDRKATYRWLVDQGYGRIRESIEKRLAKNNAAQGRPLPNNASEEAKSQYVSYVKRAEELHPHGMYWNVETKDNGDLKVTIDREQLYRVAEGLGFRSHEDNLVRIEGYFVLDQNERQFFDLLKAYVKEEDAVLYNLICNAFEAFLQRSGSFTASRIPLLDSSQIIRDTAETCYKFFLNGYLFVTADRYSFRPYENLAGKIWSRSIQPRNFVESKPGGAYVEFLRLATGLSEENKEYIQRIVGYLAHEYKDETTGYIIVLTERCDDPKKGGGSGKNIFASLFSRTTSFKSIPGSQVKQDEKFMQSWNKERVFCLSDVDKKFNFGFLKDLSTGSGLLKKLYYDDVVVEVQDMPKFIILTNFSYEVTDGGLKRRIIALEFSDFFTAAGGVDVHFKKHFPNGWTAEDWAGYDAFVAESIQSWLASGLKLSNTNLSEGGWLKQFDQSYGLLTREFIESNWSEWTNLGYVTLNQFNQSYSNFLVENNAQKNFALSSIKMNNALEDWCRKHDFVFEKNTLRTIDGMKHKCKLFYASVPF